MTLKPLSKQSAKKTQLSSEKHPLSSEQAYRSTLAEHCAASLMETVHPIMQFIRTEMRGQRDPALSVPQFRMLAFLNRHAGASLSEAAEHLGVTRATASTMTDRLVQQGLVDRSEHPQERRYVVLKLTSSGNDRLQQMRAATRLKITALLEGLTAEELTTITAGLTALNQVFPIVDSVKSDAD
ncbi:MarR family transcriptional regulator [Phormidium tenue FACHB-886]|nr:MarR family transcriptional regulator [Phormidium tenue FACHB-886]